MRKLCLLLMLQCAVFTLFAQKNQSLHFPVHKPVNPMNDKQDYQGYTIRLVPANGPGYGYIVLKNNQLVIHQTYNPFTMAPTGLDSKDDAFKVAKWQIDQITQKQNLISTSGVSQSNMRSTIQSNNHSFPGIKHNQTSVNPQFNQHLSKAVADQLNIKLNPSFSNN